MEKLHNPELGDNEKFQTIAERYPHIAKKIDLFWGCELCVPYIESLFTETRGGTRKGFPYEDILILLDIKIEHEEQFGFHLNKTDVWDLSD
ncbi:hypothetical protein [Methylophaga sp.]|uniref:hypothetical protein n=1 Tax=Methylophaga sp. TaxID=2024840 RepID=UPI003F6A0414